MRNKTKQRVASRCHMLHVLSIVPSESMSSPEPSSSVQSSIPSAPCTSALVDSYTYHSPTPTAEGPYIMGVDEAGRGPVLGPMVYGVAYCPAAWKEDLEQLGFADSKTLTHETRAGLLSVLSSEPEKLGWSVRVLRYALLWPSAQKQ